MLQKERWTASLSAGFLNEYFEADAIGYMAGGGVSRTQTGPFFLDFAPYARFNEAGIIIQIPATDLKAANMEAGSLYWFKFLVGVPGQMRLYSDGRFQVVS